MSQDSSKNLLMSKDFCETSSNNHFDSRFTCIALQENVLEIRFWKEHKTKCSLLSTKKCEESESTPDLWRKTHLYLHEEVPFNETIPCNVTLWSTQYFSFQDSSSREKERVSEKDANVYDSLLMHSKIQETKRERNTHCFWCKIDWFPCMFM